MLCISIRSLCCSADLAGDCICSVYPSGPFAVVQMWQTSCVPYLSPSSLGQWRPGRLFLCPLPCTNADLWQTFQGMNLSHLPINSAYETDFEHVTRIHLTVLTAVQMCQTSCAIHIHVIVAAIVQTYQTSCAIQTHLIVFAAVQMCQTFHVPCLCSLLYSSFRIFTQLLVTPMSNREVRT